MHSIFGTKHLIIMALCAVVMVAAYFAAARQERRFFDGMPKILWLIPNFYSHILCFDRLRTIVLILCRQRRVT